MSIRNKNSKHRQGFTIVDLLIVVVVIAILAAITIVSYNGITNQANTSSAASTAAIVKKKAELFLIDGPTKSYPRAASYLTGTADIVTQPVNTRTSPSNTWYVPPTNITISQYIPNASNGKNTISYYACGHKGTGAPPNSIAEMSTITGAKIFYYDFSKSQHIILEIGNAVQGGMPYIYCNPS